MDNQTTQKNQEQENKEILDLGSSPVEDADFDPFEEESGEETATETAEQVTPPETPAETNSEVSATEPPKSETPATPPESKDAKSEQDISEKPPVFEYAGATENIDDTSKTFDELRIEKSGDFPELEDGKRVSWSVEYGKITKVVADPKGMSIGKMKSDIETSKEFTNSLKRAKDKSPVCKIKPRVTAQSKGRESYRGVFANMSEATSSGKAISILPAKDGKVYEFRKNEIGEFVTPVTGCDLLSDVQAGFAPALPCIPAELLMKIISFFKHFMKNGKPQEALVNIYWDKQEKEFIADVPAQVVTAVSVESETGNRYASGRYIHYMDIHSHNSMRAFFSTVDDNDEKATRLYTVVGNLHEYFPDIKTRISNGGKFLEIDPLGVFELDDASFPIKWTENVKFKSQHGDTLSEVETV